MARYCADPDCPYSAHPLPADGGACPGCGSVNYRIRPGVATVVCASCDSTNEVTADACWDCGSPLSHHRLIK